MEIVHVQEKLVKFKYNILFTFVSSLVLLALIRWFPGFLTVVSYFWPLLLSTALFLAAVFLLGRSSHFPAASGIGAGAEGILQYVVAPQPEETLILDSLPSE